MPRMAKISFLGLANWEANLFSEMSWPDPFNGEDPYLDKQAFIGELLAQTAELEVSYPDPEFMKNMIGIWSKTRRPVWDLLWQTTQYEYNPIENYNRTEEGTDTDIHTGTDSHGKTISHTGQNTEAHSGADTEAHTGQNTESHSGQNTEAHTGNDTETYSGTDSFSNTKTKSGTDTNTTTPLAEHYKAAYDSAVSGDNDGLVKTERDEGETTNETVYGSTDSESGSTTLGHTITNGHGETITHGYGDTVTQGYGDTVTKTFGNTITHGFGESESESGSTTYGNTITHEHDLNVHGNIGTVTTQKMIQEQREIVTFNFYDIMIRDFKDRFCILVY